MNKMDGMSMNLIGENVEQLKRLFPEAVTEGKIDFEVLKALLGGEIETRQEYYKFTWNGKEAARAYARTRSMGTLRPCVEESSGKDGTPGKFDSENLYIEGDNLEVLKLLQGAYHKKVKMIYIDPPYNTGRDFIYPDNYRNPIGEYQALTGQANAEGKAMRAHPETSGRFHTDWLNMMYPRLILAQRLLTDDGVIFISIDDTEVDNLKKVCNEVFGEENLLGIGEWRRVEGKPGKSKYMGKTSEFVIIYMKNRDCFNIGFLPYSDAGLKEYRYQDEKGFFRRGQIFYPNRGAYSFTVKTPYGNTITGDFTKSENDFSLLDAEKMIYWAESGDHTPYLKVYLDDSGMIPTNTFGKEFGSSQSAVKEFKSIFNSDVVYFDNPKPTKLLNKLLLIANLSKDSIICRSYDII